MKTIFLTTLCFALTAAPLLANVAEAEKLAGVIRSNATATEKEDACARLKQIGNANSVPALATLLTDPHLYQAACDALETLPGREADAALLSALPQATGEAQAGILHAIGERRNPAAVPTVAKLLQDSSAQTADAAARALGKIGGQEAVTALRSNLRRAKPALRAALVDALLECAVKFERASDKAAARRIFDQFDSSREAEHVRAAAFAGLIHVSGDKSLELVARALRGKDAARQIVALQLARDLSHPKTTATLTNFLKGVPPAQQAALISLLQQRNDPAATPAVVNLARSTNAYVRVTAINALGTLGDASLVPLLAELATSRDEDDQKTARIALIQLRRGEVGAAMVKALSVAKPAEQAELARALGARWEKSAVPALLQLGRSESAATRAAAVRALSLLADGSHLRELVKLLADAREADRADVRGIFESVVDRADPKQVFDVAPITEAMATAAPELKAALLQVSALFVDEKLRAAFRAALLDAAPTVQTAAARAMCDSRDAGLLPDLLALAKTHADTTLRALALEGYVRLVIEERSGFAAAKKFELLKPAYDLAARTEDRKRVLSALGNAPVRGALELAEAALTDDAVKAEAEIACSQIAKVLLNSDPDAAEKTLLRLIESGSNENTRTNAQAALNLFDSGWRYAGPYREGSKAGNELFDVVFPPEKADSTDVKWLRAPGTSRNGEVELGGLTGGDNCVLYLKTRVFAPKAQTVKLEIGSDDGIKVWVNGEVVHANNTGRGVAPAQDIAKASLREGWNDFRAKVTQIIGGCAMILEIKSEDGKKIKGLKFDPRGAAK